MNSSGIQQLIFDSFRKSVGRPLTPTELIFMKERLRHDMAAHMDIDALDYLLEIGNDNQVNITPINIYTAMAFGGDYKPYTLVAGCARYVTAQGLYVLRDDEQGVDFLPVDGESCRPICTPLMPDSPCVIELGDALERLEA